jgi:hypothetical protein
MDPFEYFIVIPAVILGLGISRLLAGFGAALQHRGRVRIYWVHALWVIIIFLLQLQMWWSWWGLRGETFTFFTYLLRLATPLSLFLLSVIVTPEADLSAKGERLDLETHFYSARVAFFVTLTIYPLTGVLSALLMGRSFFSPAIWITLIFALLALTGVFVASRRVHGVIVVLAATIVLTYIVSFSIGMGDAQTSLASSS